MRIPFLHAGHANRFLKISQQAFSDYLRGAAAHLPTQRLRNAYCKGCGYNSYNELCEFVNSSDRAPYTAADRDSVRSALRKGFGLALEIANEYGYPRRDDGQMAELMMMRAFNLLSEAEAMHQHAEQEDAELIRIGRMVQGAVVAVWMHVNSVDGYLRTYGHGNDPETLAARRSWGRLGKMLASNGIAETGTLVGPNDSFYTFGRNLYAAVWAVAHGKRSVDNAIKRHVPERIDSAWCECAWESLDSSISTSSLAAALRSFKVLDLDDAPGKLPN